MMASTLNFENTFDHVSDSKTNLRLTMTNLCKIPLTGCISV